MPPITLDTVCVTAELSSAKLEQVKSAFKEVHYHPDSNVPDDVLAEVDIWFGRNGAIPPGIEDVARIPRTRIVQLTSAGANKLLASQLMKSDKARKQIAICSASGIHAFSIPQYIVGQVVNLFTNLYTQLYLCRKDAHWPSKADVNQDRPVEAGTNLGSIPLYGKTAGMLGYGHIARETARMLKSLNVEIIAANSSGTKREDDGYLIAGTGDKDGSLPSEYYSTNDPASFDKFLSRCDMLIASLPSTPATKYMITKEHFGKMPKNSIFVNVGRGDLARSDDILAALKTPNNLLGVALDVTDPEPLPDGHPLFTHPRAIITPHTSGDFVGYFDAAADLLLANVERVRKGGEPFNVVDPEKGY